MSGYSSSYYDNSISRKAVLGGIGIVLAIIFGIFFAITFNVGCVPLMGPPE